MKLNAAIIYDCLKEIIPIEMYGYKNKTLTLNRPEFYTDNNQPFLNDHLYILTGMSISRRMTIEKGAVILCMGDVSRFSYYRDRCCVLKIKAHSDPFVLSNKINDIFNRYDAWNDRLRKILETSADMEEMLCASETVFHNPLLLLDSDFHIIASAGYENLNNESISFKNMGSDTLSINALEQFLKEKELLMDKTEPLLLNIKNVTTCSLNLFDMGQYTGSLTVEYRKSPHQSSHDILLPHLSAFLLQAMKKNSMTSAKDSRVLKRIFSDIINGLPVETTRRKYLDAMKIQKQFVCAIMRIHDRYAQIPVKYICDKFTTIFPKSITFETGPHIISFIDTLDLSQEEPLEKTLTDRMGILTGAMDIQIGMSHVFTNPFDAALYAAQAQAALENGMLISPNDNCYFFKEYALADMLRNLQNNTAYDMYFPKGLNRLFESDKTSSASYVETLRVYLNNNMSITSTATALFVHRSTLLERLSRIKRELDQDLTDPDIRLLLQILLKSDQIQKTIVEASEK